MPLEVQVFHDDELVLTERFQDEDLAVGWSSRYEKRLRNIGWVDSPASRAS